MDELGGNGRSLKNIIDELYAKEKKYVYTKQNQRDECLNSHNIIFHLSKCHNIELAGTKELKATPPIVSDRAPYLQGTKCKFEIH